MRNLLRRNLLLALAGAMLFLTPAAFASFPTARTSARMVYDAQLGRIVLFGGLTGADSSLIRYELDDTWSWNGVRWIPLYPQHHPQARSGQTMVWDAGRSRILLFGGAHGGTSLDDTWVFENGDWRDLALEPAPSPRAFGAAAYDPASDKVIFYGGNTTTTNYYDTWTFNGSAWSSTGLNDPKLNLPMMVYDEARHQVLLMGIDSTASNTQMYAWTGSAWSHLTPAHHPDCISQAAMTYEQHNQRVLLVSGTCGDGTTADETWEWDGTDWTKLTTNPTHGLVSGATIAYDVPHQQVIMFGGNDFAVRSSTYRYRDLVWTLFNDIYSPGPRSLAVFESDPANGVSWLFGGHNDQGHLADFWQLSNGNWKLIKATGGPVGCFFPVGAFDTDRGRLVVFCDDSLTYEWDGSAWKSFSGLKNNPPNRRFSEMVYDEHLHKTVLFGGYDDVNYLDATWTWDGTAWTRLSKSADAPDARALANMFYDPIQQKTFIFGGIGRPTSNDAIRRYGDMWSFDGTKWTELTTVPKLPSIRYGSQVRFNPATQTTILFGGKDANEQYLGDEWEWNGSTWASVTPSNPPSPRMNGGFAFDGPSNHMLLFGGWSGLYYSQLWHLEGDSDWLLQRERFGRNRIAEPDSPPLPKGGQLLVPQQ